MTARKWPGVLIVKGQQDYVEGAQYPADLKALVVSSPPYWDATSTLKP